MEVSLNLPVEEPKLWIMDLDGTILDTRQALDKVVEAVLSHLKVPFDRTLVDRYHSLGTANVLRLALQEHPTLQEKAVFLGLELYKTKEYLSLLKPFPYMVEFIKKMGKKTPITVATNRAESTIPILDLMNLKNHFSTIIHAGMCKNIKPHPEMLLKIVDQYQLNPRDCFFVGNDWPDMHAGVMAQIPTLLIQPDDHLRFVRTVLEKGIQSFIRQSV
jgi:phosphoglycolate phosphatase